MSIDGKAILGMFAANIPGEEQGDYTGTDGLLYCGKCHTPKQCRIDTEAAHKVYGMAAVFPIMCQCARADEQKRYVAEQAVQREAHIWELRVGGLANPGYRAMTFDTDDGNSPKLRNAMFRYAEQFGRMSAENIGMLLSGMPGTGKTFWAGCIANKLIDGDTGVWMSPIPQIVAEEEQDYGKARPFVLERIRSTPLLILDDFGFERTTSYGLERVFEIIDTRYAAHKPLLITTNLTIDEITHPSETAFARVYSRILEMCPVTITVTGERRTAIARAKADLAREIMREV